MSDIVIDKNINYKIIYFIRWADITSQSFFPENDYKNFTKNANLIKTITNLIKTYQSVST